MARDLFSNQGTTTVSSGGTTAPAAGATESWTVASSATFPAASSTAIPVTQFYVSDPALPSETIKVTNVNGTTWSVTRGVDGTTPVAHTAGFTVRNVVAAGWLQSLDDRTNFATFNVKDPAYGAKGDNSTADHVAIQAALDDAYYAGGGQVIVPRGIYRIMATALKIRSNTRLTLMPGAEIHRYGDTNGASLVWNGPFSENSIPTNRAGYTGHGNILIEGGTWDMRCTTATTSLSSDDFNRADTAAPHTLGVMTSGQTWIDETSRGTGDQGSGNLGISSSAAYAPVAATNISTVWGWPDGTVNVTMPTTGNAGLVFRLGNSQNYWQYVRHTDGNARLSYIQNSVETVVTPTATVAVAAGNVLKVVMFGNRIQAFCNGTLTHDTTDTPGYNTNRKVGIVIFDTTARLDTFANTGQMWTDNFNRANSSSSLGTTSSGYTWTSRSGNLGITSSAASAPSAATNISTVDVTSETNVEAQVTATDASGGLGVVFRYSDNNNYWWYRRDPSTGFAKLSKFVGGVETVITAGSNVTVNANDTLFVKVMGWTIRCWVNYTAATYGSTTHDTNDSFNYQASKAGIRIDGTTGRIDNFDVYMATGGYKSGACLNFGHGENILFRDLTIRDVSSQSHGVEIAGCKNVLYDNCTFTGMAPVSGRTSEAIQMDVTKGSGYFGAFGPHDNTCNRDVVVRESSFTQSYMPGTQAWDRAVGSHTGTIGVWHDHLRVVDCFIECTNNPVRAYNWNNVFIRGNTMRTGRGIEVRTIPKSSPLDAETINTGGTQTSGSQPVSNIQIEGNVITQDGSSSSPNYAIIINPVSADSGGGDTVNGRVRGCIIRGNDIRSSLTGGIRVEQADGLIIDDNIINSLALTSSGTDTAHHGIVEVGCTEVSIDNNQVFRSGQHGIYVQGGSRIRVTNNYVKGANRSNSTFDCYKMDTSADDVMFSGNTARKWGSGFEPVYGLETGGTGTNITVLPDNDFLNGGATADIKWGLTTQWVNGVYTTRLANDTASLTATSYADVTGLTVPINAAGKYRFKCFLRYAPSTTQTVGFSINGPTANSVYYTAAIQTGAAAQTSMTAGQYATGTGAYTGSSAAVTITGPWGAVIDGYVDASATGTLAIQYKTSTGNIVVKAGSLLTIERLTL